MAFKEFQCKRTHAGAPSVAITKYGNFVLNGAVISQFFRHIKYAKLYWDDEVSKIGIKPIKKRDEHSYTVNISARGGVGTFSGHAFLKTYGINYEKTKSFLVEWNEKEGLLEFRVG